MSIIVQTYPDVSSHGERCSGMSVIVQTCPEVSSHVQITHMDLVFVTR